ncbi:MAG: response regulator [Anaerolineae bacterium]|nr:response regulator [Anaerolineae bacterium]
MEKGRLLIVEDDRDLAEMLKINFSEQGFEVEIAYKGKEGIELTRKKNPNLIILDINLPDIDGYEVCKQLRSHLRTSHIPIIFLTVRDERSDKLAGLELGADDYIIKPFDLDELRLKVRNAIQRAARENLSHPVTGLPSSRLVEEQLRSLIPRKDWAFLFFGIQYFKEFTEVYGFVAGNDVLRFVGGMLGEIVDKTGNPEDFIGHVGDDDFVVITHKAIARTIKEEAEARFKGARSFLLFVY